MVAACISIVQHTDTVGSVCSGALRGTASCYRFRWQRRACRKPGIACESIPTRCATVTRQRNGSHHVRNPDRQSTFERDLGRPALDDASAQSEASGSPSDDSAKKAEALGYDGEWSPLEFDTDISKLEVDKSTNRTLSLIIETLQAVEITRVFVRVSIKNANLWSQPSQVGRPQKTAALLPFGRSMAPSGRRRGALCQLTRGWTPSTNRLPSLSSWCHATAT